MNPKIEQHTEVKQEIESLIKELAEKNKYPESYFDHTADEPIDYLPTDHLSAEEEEEEEEERFFQIVIEKGKALESWVDDEREQFSTCAYGVTNFHLNTKNIAGILFSTKAVKDDSLKATYNWANSLVDIYIPSLLLCLLAWALVMPWLIPGIAIIALAIDIQNYLQRRLPKKEIKEITFIMSPRANEAWTTFVADSKDVKFDQELTPRQ